MTSDNRTERASDSSPTPPAIEVEVRPARAPAFAAMVSLHGEHDTSTRPELAAALAPLEGDVLLDLTDCGFIDSSVIGVLIAKSADLARTGHRLEVVVPAANRVVARVVDVVGLRTLMPVHDALASAVGTDDAMGCA